MMKNLITGVVAGVICFIWVMVSWMALPFHGQSMNTFKNQEAVKYAITVNAPESGMYAYPGMEGDPKKMTSEPHIFASVNLGGKDFKLCMLKAMAGQVVGGILLTLLVAGAKLPSFESKVKFILLVSLFAGAVGAFQNWNWYSFSTGFTALEIIDLVIGWGLAGLWIAKRV